MKDDYLSERQRMALADAMRRREERRTRAGDVVIVTFWIIVLAVTFVFAALGGVHLVDIARGIK